MKYWQTPIHGNHAQVVLISLVDSVTCPSETAAGPIGYLSMIFGMGPAWLITWGAGLAGGAFPLAIFMFNLRTRTTLGSAAIAGFAMGIGYLADTLGPLLGGWLYATTGSWTMALWVYAVTVLPIAIGSLMMARPGRYPEDKFAWQPAAAGLSAD